MITLKDIINRKFNKTFRGYDPVEVHYFLEMMGEEFKKMETKIRDFEQIDIEFRKIDGTTPGQILAGATEKAAQIVIDAERVATEALQGAKREKDKIDKTITNLKFEREKIIHSFKQIVKKQNDIIQTYAFQEGDISFKDDLGEQNSDEEY